MKVIIFIPIFLNFNFTDDMATTPRNGPCSLRFYFKNSQGHANLGDIFRLSCWTNLKTHSHYEKLSLSCDQHYWTLSLSFNQQWSISSVLMLSIVAWWQWCTSVPFFTTIKCAKHIRVGFYIVLLSKLHLACFQVLSTREKEISLKIAMALATFEIKPKVARAILGGGWLSDDPQN